MGTLFLRYRRVAHLKGRRVKEMMNTIATNTTQSWGRGGHSAHNTVVERLFLQGNGFTVKRYAMEKWNVEP